jgi:hypothetical protein
VKPVSLNQLLFHPKSDSLSFFLGPLENEDVFEKFFDDMLLQIKIQERFRLAKVLEKEHDKILKILRNHLDVSHGFFIAEDFQGYVVLDQRVQSYCIISQTFHVRPLLEELFVNPEYMLVNISLYDIKIFRGDFQHLEIIEHYEFDQLPKNFSGNASRIYAPQYLGLLPYKTILAIQTIAKKIKDLILYHSLPVIITGLEEMKTIFLRYFDESAGVISHLQEDFYEKTCVEILQRSRAFRTVVMDYYSFQLKERLKRMMKSKRFISDLQTIIVAAYSGRIAHLVLPTEKKIWGKFNPETGEFTIHKRITKSSIDILNALAEEVIKRGGKIQILRPHFFPQSTKVIAILEGPL